ncbi:hypothetical protein TUSST3_86840 [Streptomyces sp. TUS-ST3]|uniref:DUF1801 domain-containing protein n=1 Tax=Streptomyces antibioticus TaxID=1890 RepID=A0ABX3LGM5_STRAT|nr:hypothetical protein AFM16_26140 [Streptomyces antibioticus]GLP72066.1 hypothetical protein TUSST3_86840 [Streptomyces sp. TUS-ST3]
MSYEVDLAVRVEDVLDDLPAEGRREVIETIAAALVRPELWPAPGGWDGTLTFGPRAWVAFTSFLGGIQVYDAGWTG